jgi:hypothetical protein
VTDSSQPPICHIHARPHASPIIPPPDQIDEMKILQKLARDSDPRVRLRAVDLLIDLKAKAKIDPDKRAADESDNFLDELTSDELARLDALLASLRDFKEEIYSTRPHLRPSGGRPPDAPEDVAPEM